MKHEKKREFSKVILVYAAILNTIVILSTIVIVFYTRDTTPLMYLIPAVATEVASGTGMYYWKTKSCNIYRYGEAFILDLTDKIGAETAAQVAQAFMMNAR